MLLQHQLENYPFLRDADGNVVMVAWCIKRIEQFGTRTEFVRILTCLFETTGTSLPAEDVGIVFNLTLAAKFADLLQLHSSLMKWGRQEKFIRSMCK